MVVDGLSPKKAKAEGHPGEEKKERAQKASLQTDKQKKAKGAKLRWH